MHACHIIKPVLDTFLDNTILNFSTFGDTRHNVSRLCERYNGEKNAHKKEQLRQDTLTSLIHYKTEKHKMKNTDVVYTYIWQTPHVFVTTDYTMDTLMCHILELQLSNTNNTRDLLRSKFTLQKTIRVMKQNKGILTTLSTPLKWLTLDFLEDWQAYTNAALDMSFLRQGKPPASCTVKALKDLCLQNIQTASAASAVFANSVSLHMILHGNKIHTCESIATTLFFKTIHNILHTIHDNEQKTWGSSWDDIATTLFTSGDYVKSTNIVCSLQDVTYLNEFIKTHVPTLQDNAFFNVDPIEKHLQQMNNLAYLKVVPFCSTWPKKIWTIMARC